MICQVLNVIQMNLRNTIQMQQIIIEKYKFRHTNPYVQYGEVWWMPILGENLGRRGDQLSCDNKTLDIRPATIEPQNQTQGKWSIVRCQFVLHVGMSANFFWKKIWTPWCFEYISHLLAKNAPSNPLFYKKENNLQHGIPE